MDQRDLIPDRPRLGWIGTGRMGYAMVSRLLEAGHDVAVWNRTRAKCEPLAEHGARIVDSIGELADRDVVFSMVSASADFAEVTLGEGEAARLVKLCHNVVLGVLTQALAEVTVLAEKGGVSRAALLDFLNGSVVGSPFTRYKTPAFVSLDLTPTFTPVLMRKDFDIAM